ncbi:MAG: RluA family pseudouridine synthase [Bacteroidetes bacterium]|nr:RluA family pseudouridine synthase [Bacteroidota bacterium]
MIDKPAHLLVLPDRYNQSLVNLYHMLKEEFGDIYVVHRIDKETSGVIVFSKDAETHAALNSQFEERQVEKTYLTIVTGAPDEMEGKIDVPISPSQTHPGVMKVNRKHGKPSVTNYRVVELFNGYALLEAEPESGRMHQIRVHLASVGLPVMCDKVYGDGAPFFLSQVKKKYFSEGDEKPLLARTALHAESVSFRHPRTNEQVVFKSELPKDMRSVLNYLRKFRSQTMPLLQDSGQTSMSNG